MTIKFMTYDQVLTIDMIGWIIVYACLMGTIPMFDSPPWATSITCAILCQLGIFKCWADMTIKSQPFLNCWAYKDWWGFHEDLLI